MFYNENSSTILHRMGAGIFFQCCRSGFIESGSSILAEYRSWSGIRNRNFFCWPKIKKTAEKICLHKGCPIYRKSLSPQKRTSRTSKHEFLQLFPIFWGHFSLLAPDPLTWLNPDPQHSFFVTIPLKNSVRFEPLLVRMVIRKMYKKNPGPKQIFWSKMLYNYF